MKTRFCLAVVLALVAAQAHADQYVCKSKTDFYSVFVDTTALKLGVSRCDAMGAFLDKGTPNTPAEQKNDPSADKTITDGSGFEMAFNKRVTEGLIIKKEVVIPYQLTIHYFEKTTESLELTCTLQTTTEAANAQQIDCPNEK